jgi:hypothetical protein
MLKKLIRSRRFTATAIHLLSSAAVSALAALLVFRVWYPWPFDQLAGGGGLFVLLMCVDVVIGPTLTLVIANPAKPRAELRRDLVIIVVLQIAAFAYGIYSVALARPVALSFEIDRFRLVVAAEIDDESLKRAPAGFDQLPWLGPRRVAALKPTDPAQQERAIALGMAGVDLSMQPSTWVDLSTRRQAAWAAARPVSVLASKYPQAGAELAKIADQAHVDPAAMRFLPLMSRRGSWVVILADSEPLLIGYLPLEGFF